MFSWVWSYLSAVPENEDGAEWSQELPNGDDDDDAGAAMSDESFRLSFIATDLPNKGFPFRKSAPYAIIERNGEILGETEYILHDLNPDWTKTFYYPADDGEESKIEVTVMDYRGKGRTPLKICTFEFEAKEDMDDEIKPVESFMFQKPK